MPAPEIVVHEKRPRWAPELQRQFVGEEVRVRGCRSLADAVPRAADAAPRVVVLDLEAAPAETLHFLGHWGPKARRWPVVVIGSTRTADLEWPARELGALAFLPEEVSGEDLARLCRRQWASTAA